MYVERQKVLDKGAPINGCFCNMISAWDVAHIPAANVVPVVHCRDCKHLTFSDCYGECGKGYLGIVNPDDFCSRGQKRKDDVH